MSDLEVEVGGAELANASNEETAELHKELNPGQESEVKTTDGQDDEDDDSAGDDRSAKVDSELEGAANDADREVIRARRREDRARRKQHGRDKLDSLERTLSDQVEQNRRLTEQVMRLTNNDASAKLGQLDAAIEEAQTAVNHYNAVMADATAKSDGATSAKALNLMLTARDRFTTLTSVKANLLQGSKQPSPLDPVVRNAAAKFSDKHKWYRGAQSTDPDSAVLTMLDNAVARDGFNPVTDAYWAELEARGKRYIPHRFSPGSGDLPSDGDKGYTPGNDERKPKTPVGGSSQRSNVGGSQDAGFLLSAERVKAMKEAGIWDDPVKRKAMVTRYKESDKARQD